MIFGILRLPIKILCFRAELSIIGLFHTLISLMFRRCLNVFANAIFLVLLSATLLFLSMVERSIANCPHFHGMIFTPKIKNESLSERLTREYDYHHKFFKSWCRNVGSTRSPIYKPCSKYIVTSNGSTYDFHWVNPVSTQNAEADVGFYITKYILKSSKYVDSLKSALKLNLAPEEFAKEWFYFKPRCCVSKGFGNFNSPKVKEHIERGIKTALSDSTLPYPIFINPISGQEFPLAPCYKKRFLTMQDAITFWTRGKDDDFSLTDNFRQNVQDVINDDIWLEDVRDYLDSSENSFNFLDLDFYA